MLSKANTFLNKALGEDFLESLAKTELYKPNANVAIDLEDIRIGLKVVPRLILSMLIRELPPMKIGEQKTIHLMLGMNAIMNVNKHDTDTYSGSIVDDGKQLVNFKYRPLPGVGLVIMSAFELYELEELAKEPSKHFEPNAEIQVQKLIDDRLALHHMVGQVVEHKMMEREAIQKLFHSKITQELAEANKKLSQIAELPKINETSTPQSDEYFRGMTNGAAVAAAVATGQEPNFIDHKPKSDVANESVPIRLDPVVENGKKYAAAMNHFGDLIEEQEKQSINKSKKKESPLKGFLDKKNAKKGNDLTFQLVKAADTACPDCRQELFKNQVYTGCVCMGENMDSKVWVKKSDSGVSIRFSKDWTPENMELLLDLLRRKNG